MERLEIYTPTKQNTNRKEEQRLVILFGPQRACIFPHRFAHFSKPLPKGPQTITNKPSEALAKRSDSLFVIVWGLSVRLLCPNLTDA